jgi:hypothetical protein
MEEAAENNKELSRSAHGNGMIVTLLNFSAYYGKMKLKQMLQQLYLF